MSHTENTSREQPGCSADSRRCDDFVAQVRTATDIESVAATYGRIVHYGSRSLTPCPCQQVNAQQSVPSLFLHQEQQIGKCCVCLAQGDVFWLVMEHEQLCYRDAVRLLAARAGIEEPAGLMWSTNHKRRPQAMTEPDGLRVPLTLGSLKSARQLKI